jgi:hypothetical protein
MFTLLFAIVGVITLVGVIAVGAVAAYDAFTR